MEILHRGMQLYLRLEGRHYRSITSHSAWSSAAQDGLGVAPVPAGTEHCTPRAFRQQTPSPQCLPAASPEHENGVPALLTHPLPSLGPSPSPGASVTTCELMGPRPGSSPGFWTIRLTYPLTRPPPTSRAPGIHRHLGLNTPNQKPALRQPQVLWCPPLPPP